MKLYKNQCLYRKTIHVNYIINCTIGFLALYFVITKGAVWESEEITWWFYISFNAASMADSSVVYTIGREPFAVNSKTAKNPILQLLLEPLI